ncbi:MAG: hypothetical protein WC325_10580, partial [Candidatus Bathyarchaeia archaeon]
WVVRFVNNTGWTINATSSVAISANTWYPIEIRTLSDVSVGGAELWVNGTKIISKLDQPTSTTLNNVVAFQAGLIDTVGSGSARSFYVDCVVVADSYIGVEASDSVAPTFGAVSANSTVAGAGVNVSCAVSDETAVSGWILEQNNTGTPSNTTWASGSAASWVGTWNSTVGSKVTAKVYANDTSNNWNSTSATFTLTDGSVPTFGIVTANSTLAGNATLLSCTVGDNVAVGTVIFEWNNTGTPTNQTALSGSGTSYIANLTGTWNGTFGNVVSVKVYANDSANNWAASGITNFTLTHDVYVYAVSFSKAEANVLQGDLVHFTISVLQNSSAYSDFVANITRDGSLLKPNATSTFDDTEANNQGHTYNISGLYDTSRSVAITDYTVTPLDVVWQSVATGPTGPSGPTATPTPSGGVEPTPTGSGDVDGDGLPIEFNFPFSSDEILIGVAIIAISSLVALSLMQHKSSRSSLRKKHNQPLMSGSKKGKKDSSLL